MYANLFDENYITTTIRFASSIAAIQHLLCTISTKEKPQF